MASKTKKLQWFELGAKAIERDFPGEFSVPTYPCPICLTPFTVEAVVNNRLSSEHVPPESVGGEELLLTCTKCNNTAGTLLDADAKTKEDVNLAMAGKAGRPHRVKVMVGDLTVNGTLHAVDGKYSLEIPAKINKPGTSELLKERAKAGAQLTLQHEPFSELGARISWLRSGYLALVAFYGFRVAYDPAMEIVRKQIMECDGRKMVTFTSDVQLDFPLRTWRILKVIDPAWDKGWAVQFGKYFVRLPSLGDMDFYDRIVSLGGVEPKVNNTTYEYQGWPTRPTFGMADDDVLEASIEI
jgi:hypothetical protein